MCKISSLDAAIISSLILDWAGCNCECFQFLIFVFRFLFVSSREFFFSAKGDLLLTQTFSGDACVRACVPAYSSWWWWEGIYTTLNSPRRRIAAAEWKRKKGERQRENENGCCVRRLQSRNFWCPMHAQLEEAMVGGIKVGGEQGGRER